MRTDTECGNGASVYVNEAIACFTANGKHTGGIDLSI